jgi:hypothetical protein
MASGKLAKFYAGVGQDYTKLGQKQAAYWTDFGQKQVEFWNGHQYVLKSKYDQ